MDVVGPQVAGCRAFFFADPHALDQNIFVNGARTGRDDIGFADLARQTRREID